MPQPRPDRGEFEELYGRHVEGMLGHARPLVGHPDLDDDVISLAEDTDGRHVQALRHDPLPGLVRYFLPSWHPVGPGVAPDPFIVVGVVSFRQRELEEVGAADSP